MSVPALYKHKSSARAAAIKALGKDGPFEIVSRDDGMFYWIDTSEAAAEAAGAENDPTPAYTSPEPEEGVLDALSDPEPQLPTVDEIPAVSEAEPAPFAEPQEKANLTVDLGITPELAALILGLGEAAGAAIPVPQKRKGITADAWAAAERGELPGDLVFPASNLRYAIHSSNLLQLTEAGDRAALEAYYIGGTNTYSKALQDYRKALLCYLDNKPQMKEAA